MNTETMINIQSLLTKPHDEENVELTQILSGRLKRLGREKTYVDNEQRYYWSADVFGLPRSNLYLKSNAEQKHRILVRCNENLLLESYFIEKLGLTFCAKMILTAENTEMAQAYSLIGADEATHLRWLTPFVPSSKRGSPVGEFINYTANLVSIGDPNSLAYLLQVILEGWGLHHYRLLSNHCACLQLKEVLSDIVRDEALHHQAGTILFSPNQVTDQQQIFIQDSLVSFLEMIRVGPQAIINVIDFELGGLSKTEKITLTEELSGPVSANNKLRLMKQLMLIPGAEKFVKYLESKDLFKAYSPEQCLVT